MCPTTTTSFSLIWESQPQLDALGLLACRCRAALLQAACWGWRDGQASTDPVSAAREVVLGFASGLSQVQRTSAGLVAQHRWQMESVEDVSEQLEPCEDETTVPTGPWEEDGNEDCPAYHTAAFRMYVMKILPCFKRYCHDWTICPFAHPGEKARRRDPRSAKYAGIACPEMKKATHHRTASQPQLGQGSALQPPPPPPPHARRHSLAEATPRHRKARQADAQAQSMHSYSAAQRRLPPHVQAAMGTAPQQRKGGSQVPSSREGTREGPQQQAAGAKAGQQGDVWTRAALQHTAAAVQHLQALPQANHASASPHAHGTASVLAKTPERPSSVEGLWLGAGMSADSIAQPGWAAPVPDLAAQARETLYAMGQQQRLPVFPESEDSGELTERMRLLSMAHSQTTETLMRQNYSLQPLQRSASGPAPPVELQHPFLAAGSGSSSVPLPLPSLQQQQQQKQARQLDPASSYSLQPRVSRPAYPPVSTLRGQHFDSFGPGQHPVSLSERGACLDGGHHMEQVVSEPTYQSVAGAEGMPDSFTGYPVTGVLGQAENPMFAHGHSATEARVLRDWQDAGALRDFQASLARSLSYDQSGLLLQGGPAYQIDDPASGIMLGHLVAPSGQYGRDMQVPREAQAAVALKASAVGSPSSMYGYPPSEPGQPHMR